MLLVAFCASFRQNFEFRRELSVCAISYAFSTKCLIAVELLTDWLNDLVDTQNSSGCAVLFKILGTVH